MVYRAVHLCNNASFNVLKSPASWMAKIFLRSVATDDKHKFSKDLVVGLYQNDKSARLTVSGQKFDDKLQGLLKKLVNECNMSGRLGMEKVFNNLDSEFRSVAVVGLVREGAGFNELEMLDEEMENVRIAAAVGAMKLQMQGCTEVFVDSIDYPDQAAEGSALAVYQYQDHKKKEDKTHVPKLELFDFVHYLPF